MAASISTRAGASAMLAVAMLASTGCASAAGGQAPIVRQAPSAEPAPAPAVRPANPAADAKQHLPEWIDRHRDLSPQQQQQALESEPGFRQLSAETQKRMLNRLAQLDAMAPQQRQRVLERAEQMEHLSPGQRQQVRGAMAELGRLPADRRKVVARAFRDLRVMPQNQRQAYLSSEYLHRELSPQERMTLGNLMTVEPLLPPPNRGIGPQPPQ